MARKKSAKERLRDALPKNVLRAVQGRRHSQHIQRKKAYLEAQRQGRPPWGDWAFIHINKCGGTSVEAALGMPTKIHDTARQRRAAIGAERWEAMTTFALIRHPYDRLCSHYRYIIRTNRRGMGQDPIGLNAWIGKVLDARDPKYLGDPRMVMPCFDWIADETGQILVDVVGRLETLNTDWPRIQGITGSTAALPVANTTNRRNGQVSELSDHSRALIQQVFVRDFDHFGYDV